MAHLRLALSAALILALAVHAGEEKGDEVVDLTELNFDELVDSGGSKAWMIVSRAVTRLGCRCRLLIRPSALAPSPPPPPFASRPAPRRQSQKWPAALLLRRLPSAFSRFLRRTFTRLGARRAARWSLPGGS